MSIDDLDPEVRRACVDVQRSIEGHLVAAGMEPEDAPHLFRAMYELATMQGRPPEERLPWFYFRRRVRSEFGPRAGEDRELLTAAHALEGIGKMSRRDEGQVVTAYRFECWCAVKGTWMTRADDAVRMHREHQEVMSRKVRNAG